MRASKQGRKEGSRLWKFPPRPRPAPALPCLLWLTSSSVLLLLPSSPGRLDDHTRFPLLHCLPHCVLALPVPS